MALSDYPHTLKALKAENPALVANGGLGSIALKASSLCFIDLLNHVRMSNSLPPISIDDLVSSTFGELEDKLNPQVEGKSLLGKMLQ